MLVGAITIFLFVFIIAKYGFAFFAWLSIEDSDSIYRKHLDNLWDALNRRTLYELVHDLVDRLVSRLGLTRIAWPQPSFFILTILILLINYAAILISFSCVYTPQ